MATLYVLDVPEFAAFVDVARARGWDLRTTGDYVEVSAPGRIAYTRDEVGARPAVWFAGLTGGMVGTIVRFDEDVLWIDE